jgi:hypothetical protein
MEPLVLFVMLQLWHIHVAVDVSETFHAGVLHCHLRIQIQ